jgi:hypothetical protein
MNKYLRECLGAFFAFLLSIINFYNGGMENGKNVYEYDDDDLHGKNDV